MRTTSFLPGGLALSIGLLISCGGGGGDAAAPGAPLPNDPGFVPTTGAVTVTELATGLPNPWSLAFLPDGRMLVTGRTGSLRLYAANGQSFTPINLAGLSNLSTAGQGGLLDVVPDPAFASNRRIYLSFSEADPGNANLNGTAVARAELDTGAQTLVGLQVIYQQLPKVASTGHFGSRLVFDRDGHLFVTLGDRQSNDLRVFAQDLNRGNGKVVRITTSGAAAPGNRSSRARRPASGATATATRRAPRCTRTRVPCGPASTARKAAMKSTSRRPDATTAGL